MPPVVNGNRIEQPAQLAASKSVISAATSKMGRPSA